MLHFESDYNNGACIDILKKLAETNDILEAGYGFDSFSISAREKIKEACGLPDADIYFLVGGTQTNQTVISSMLRPFEGVVAAQSGHVSVHEAGAVEVTGHKVLTVPEHDGKMTASELKAFLETYHNDGNRDHMVYPGMVYISFPTELGTLYSKKELTDIYCVCREYSIPLYVDGARLGYGIMSRENDMTLKEFASLSDVFYIGGTKMGALCGEAVVFTHNNAPEHFFSMVKQRGALLAKGRLLGVQFDALFSDDLYFRLGKNAIDTAEELKRILREKNYRFFLETPTNQQFVIVENSRLAELDNNVVYSFWDKYDETHTLIRFCTSWATTAESLRELESVL